MKIFLMILLAVCSIILIVSVLLQSGSTAGLSGSIAGGAEQLLGKKKSKGYEAILEKITTVGAILFIILSLVIVTLFE
ncbi:MAG: preprotein translocase subunit SecG [Firmicutes bacterium]|nr:preprotein translocase subunit SecG [Bacillota bacterium]MBQ1431210.1 preprotein translocase subunit SecG [Bacillota bacterium]MBQ1691141.1 preprotein translocase subunit SecG [Bacillota bacterium]MBQ2305778.1 preprotein translocase subunit SecG [Bacillota bacterium]